MGYIWTVGISIPLPTIIGNDANVCRLTFSRSVAVTAERLSFRFVGVPKPQGILIVLGFRPIPLKPFESTDLPYEVSSAVINRVRVFIELGLWPFDIIESRGVRVVLDFLSDGLPYRV